jgi:hypothetical protein
MAQQGLGVLEFEVYAYLKYWWERRLKALKALIIFDEAEDGNNAYSALIELEGRLNEVILPKEGPRNIRSSQEYVFSILRLEYSETIVNWILGIIPEYIQEIIDRKCYLEEEDADLLQKIIEHSKGFSFMSLSDWISALQEVQVSFENEAYL